MLCRVQRQIQLCSFLWMIRTCPRLKTCTLAPGLVASAHQDSHTSRKCQAIGPGKRDADRVLSRISGWSPRCGEVGSFPLLRGACVPPCGDVGQALWFASFWSSVLVGTLRELAMRGTSISGKISGELLELGWLRGLCWRTIERPSWICSKSWSYKGRPRS